MSPSPSLIELGQVFAGLKLPPIHPGRPFYLHPVTSLWGSVQSALKAEAVRPEYFTSEADFQRCLRTNVAWTMQLNFTANDAHSHFVSHTVADLLAQWHSGAEQARAASLFQEYFSSYHLCQNDHIESGFDLEEFLNGSEVRAGFFGDEADRAACLENQQVWTLVEYHYSHTVWASSTLEGLLKRAWEHHPALCKATRLESSLGAPHTTGPRPRM